MVWQNQPERSLKVVKLQWKPAQGCVRLGGSVHRCVCRQALCEASARRRLICRYITLTFIGFKMGGNKSGWVLFSSVLLGVRFSPPWKSCEYRTCSDTSRIPWQLLGCNAMEKRAGGWWAVLCMAWRCHCVAFLGSDTHGYQGGGWPLAVSVRIIESLRLKKASTIIKSNHQPITTMPAKPCPEVPHLHVFWTPPGMVTPPVPWAVWSNAWPLFQ